MNKGSVFLEIILTISIAGMVGFIIFKSFSRTEESVRINNIQSSLGSLVATALACVDSKKELSSPYAGDPICESAYVAWSALPDDWVYTEVNYDFNNATFSFGARSESEKKEIRCNPKGCVLDIIKTANE